MTELVWLFLKTAETKIFHDVGNDFKLNKFTNHSLDGLGAYNVTDTQALSSFFYGFKYPDPIGVIK